MIKRTLFIPGAGLPGSDSEAENARRPAGKRGLSARAEVTGTSELRGALQENLLLWGCEATGCTSCGARTWGEQLHAFGASDSCLLVCDAEGARKHSATTLFVDRARAVVVWWGMENVFNVFTVETDVGAGPGLLTLWWLHAFECWEQIGTKTVSLGVMLLEGARWVYERTVVAEMRILLMAANRDQMSCSAYQIGWCVSYWFQCWVHDHANGQLRRVLHNGWLGHHYWKMRILLMAAE
jgi:hypothetical protein